MKYSLKRILKQILGLVHDKRTFGYLSESATLPDNVIISNPSNIFVYDRVSISSGAILYATNAKIIIKKFFVSAYGLKISTGQHERRIGRFLGSITEVDKNHSLGLDKDVIINEDVWAGFNVCIMAGVEIGRGCTLAAGTVVTKSIPPYCIAAGVPAKVIKFYWSIEQILEHEKYLYKEEERYTKEELIDIFREFKQNI